MKKNEGRRIGDNEFRLWVLEGREERIAIGALRRRQGCLNIGTNDYHFMLRKPASEE